jgi:uncharacterized protein (UPF0261 family)
MAGMILNIIPPSATAPKKTIGLSRLGVTTPCVQAVARPLEADYDCHAFHATGTGGLALAKRVASGFVEAMLDWTTTEIVCLQVGGVLPATEARLEVVIDVFHESMPGAT